MSSIMRPGVMKWQNYVWIDPKIKRLMIMLHSLGFQTVSCCEGHEKPDRYGNLNKLYIAFFIPDEGKCEELESLYRDAVSRLAGHVPRGRLDEISFCADSSRSGKRYVNIDVNEHWKEEEYMALREALSEAAWDRVEDPYIGDKIDMIFY